MMDGRLTRGQLHTWALCHPGISLLLSHAVSRLYSIGRDIWPLQPNLLKRKVTWIVSFLMIFVHLFHLNFITHYISTLYVMVETVVKCYFSFATVNSGVTYCKLVNWPRKVDIINDG